MEIPHFVRNDRHPEKEAVPQFHTQKCIQMPVEHASVFDFKPGPIPCRGHRFVDQQYVIPNEVRNLTGRLARPPDQIFLNTPGPVSSIHPQSS